MVGHVLMSFMADSNVFVEPVILDHFVSTEKMMILVFQILVIIINIVLITVIVSAANAQKVLKRKIVMKVIIVDADLLQRVHHRRIIHQPLIAVHQRNHLMLQVQVDDQKVLVILIRVKTVELATNLTMVITTIVFALLGMMDHIVKRIYVQGVIYLHFVLMASANAVMVIKEMGMIVTRMMLFTRKAPLEVLKVKPHQVLKVKLHLVLKVRLHLVLDIKHHQVLVMQGAIHHPTLQRMIIALTTLSLQTKFCKTSL